MTPSAAVVAVHVLAVVWTNSATGLSGMTVLHPAPQFPSYEACVKAIPDYESMARLRYGGRGKLDCVKR